MYTIIVAGGDGKRMGCCKASLPYRNTTLALYLAEKYEVLGPVAFAVNKIGGFETDKYPVFEDLYPGDGPLNGLASAFANTDEEYVFLASVDMPYVEPALVQTLQEMCSGHDACVVVKGDGEIEGFCGVYSHECDYFVDDVMRVGRNTFRDLFFQIDVRYVKATDLPNFNLEQNTKRILTPQDYAVLNDTK